MNFVPGHNGNGGKRQEDHDSPSLGALHGYIRSSFPNTAGTEEEENDGKEPFLWNERMSTSGRSMTQQGLMVASSLMKRLGHLLAGVVACGVVVTVPVLTIQALENPKVRTDYAAFYSAGAFVLVTVLLSTREIYRHLTHWYMPDVQKYCVRIIWMVPVYAIQSWLSLRFHNARIYIDTFRDLYEAFVIQSFVYYLIELLGGEEALVGMLQSKDAHYGQHHGPLKYFVKEWEMGMEFLLQCKRGVLQYVVMKTMATLLTALLEPIGWYGEGHFKMNMAYPYVAFIMNLSVMYALYCLVILFHATSEELRHPVNWHPLGKFLCIKGVVFFTWWQGVVLFFLKANGIIGDVGNWHADEVAHGLQDYLVCVEMFFFAIAHMYTYTYEEYLPSATMKRSESHRYLSQEGGGGGGGWAGNSFLFGSQQQQQPQSSHDRLDQRLIRGEDHDEEDDDDAYRPPVIRTLQAPMGFRDAFWSSTVPNEALNDIRRLRNGVSDEIINSQSSGSGMIHMGNMQHAESI
uniref:Transmembrane protein 184C n=1 Tax=Attheya septentrionalis TaxID=420275 RepID=A0A7S2UHS0_9STRA|mmetsp:Transcript_24205/g.43736  ORF Transcript_24205/g.43736 Transcript_24205/m.43736 type:complete len:517 (+) Transcript_24205:146-1696(+)|eukprot:CAMPEP_0198305284 /NCGR_PEP_ID=MMETSP1449-20131203/57830_1 /TAXON_ID=420275 /ORGANISM="Attheya septentrionalis, Strain CCMP2084" /LENGTH=516 /DNA_ID=CAMNT_0044007817 /DNA_START=95 /DNA_END=1645 /DNA_ORIENTATION=+